MTDDELIEYYSQGVPVDEALLAPLGLVTWAAIRLHHAVRDSLGIDFGTQLSDQPFDRTLGQVIGDLEKAATAAGEPWKAEIETWVRGYGRPAQKERDRITHAVAYTAPDGKQALRTAARHGQPQRITIDILQRATGCLVLASVRLDEARKRCRDEEA